MIKQFLEKLKKLSRERVSFDPSTLNDPVAMQTDWSPVEGGGASFCTHKLAVVDSSRLEFRPAVGGMLFYLLFLILGLGVVGGVLYYAFSSGGIALDKDTVIPLLIGSIFAVVGAVMLYFGTEPIVFDKSKRWFWKGRVSPDQIADKHTLKCFSYFVFIYALQIISEYCSGSENSFYSYELNLVLKDGTRINIVDHGSLTQLREDAATLSNFLDKPVWDAT